jgi:Lon protease-like protein
VVTWLPDDPYPLALVEHLPDPPMGAEALDALAEADQAVRRALALAAELEEPAAPANVEVDGDPSVAAYQLAAIAPLGPVDRQRLLEQEDPAARLRLLTSLATDAAAVLAYRLSAG